MLYGIIAVTIIIICSIFLTLMARFAVRPKVHTLEYELEYLNKIEFMRGESLVINQEYYITSFDGYRLWAGLVTGNPDNPYYAVLSHGYTSTRYGMYKYAALWRRMGFNCIIYDNRGHGANPPATCTFGLVESKDLMAVIEDTYQRYGRDIHIGLHGESMGAGLQLMALEYKPKVDFIVNDCGYSEILPVLQWKTQQSFHLPPILAVLASPFNRLFFGYWFQKVRPIDNLKENEIPICFVHGLADTFTHVWHSQKMYEVNKGYKELHLYEDADHADCVIADSKRYLKMLEDFVNYVYGRTVA